MRLIGTNENIWLPRLVMPEAGAVWPPAHNRPAVLRRFQRNSARRETLLYARGLRMIQWCRTLAAVRKRNTGSVQVGFLCYEWASSALRSFSTSTTVYSITVSGFFLYSFLWCKSRPAFLAAVSLSRAAVVRVLRTENPVLLPCTGTTDRADSRSGHTRDSIIHLFVVLLYVCTYVYSNVRKRDMHEAYSYCSRLCVKIRL